MICILQLIDQFLLRSRAVLATTSDDYIYIMIFMIVLISIHQLPIIVLQVRSYFHLILKQEAYKPN